MLAPMSGVVARTTERLYLRSARRAGGEFPGAAMVPLLDGRRGQDAFHHVYNASSHGKRPVDPIKVLPAAADEILSLAKTAGRNGNAPGAAPVFSGK
jgi:hypothetical protein